MIPPILTIAPDSVDSQSPLDEPASSHPPSYGTILVVANRREYRDKVQVAMQSRGVATIGTASELNALELMGRGNLFDAVLVDADPRQNSDLRIVQQLLEQRPSIPVVVTLTEDESQFLDKTQLSGVFRCVSSTSPDDEVSNTLSEAVASTRNSKSPR
jgi:DNA-binding NarL/FixJ family response regulator